MLVFSKDMDYDEHHPTNHVSNYKQVVKNAVTLLTILGKKIKSCNTEQKLNATTQLNNTLITFIHTFGETKTVFIFCKACKSLGFTIRPVNDWFKMLLISNGIKFKSS
jgi:hypothetical protein